LLQRVPVIPKPVDDYAHVVAVDVLDELRALAVPLRGSRVAHVNATAYGGGVSELLHSLVPLYRGLEIEADWLVIPGDPEFFRVTKRIHNALQGARIRLSRHERDVYVDHNRVVAEQLNRGYDFVVIHDPQPAAVRSLVAGPTGRWIWRCHIDTSHPNSAVLEFIAPFLGDYDVLVFTLDEFVPDALRGRPHVLVPPAIDPLSPKNAPLPAGLARQIVEWTGVPLDRPLITQVSRFDPWKDPIGVVEVFRQVRETEPLVQLALVGQMALDDPQGWELYRQIVEQTAGDPSIHVLTNLTGIGNTEVNAFQTHSDIVLQKSVREGFGLVVSETLWKGTPMVAGRAGGIPMQMPPGIGGYVVDEDDQFVDRVTELLADPETGRALGARGRRHVRHRFLTTRLLADELRLLGSLSSSRGPNAGA
jgi:trehalose synthase